VVSSETACFFGVDTGPGSLDIDGQELSDFGRFPGVSPSSGGTKMSYLVRSREFESMVHEPFIFLLAAVVKLAITTSLSSDLSSISIGFSAEHPSGSNRGCVGSSFIATGVGAAEMGSNSACLGGSGSGSGS
jgi:hypothetical protein